jgi:streptomycin 6-kinase
MRAPDGAPSALDPTLGRLAISWRTYWPDAALDRLADDVRERCAAALDAWRLRDAQPLPGGFVALVCGVVTSDGRPAILKVSPRGHPGTAQLAAEADALAFWQPSGAVPTLLGRRDDGLTVLMERVEPGWRLEAPGIPWARRLLLLGQVVARLHALGRPPDDSPGAGFSGATEYTRSWRVSFADRPDLIVMLDELTRPRDSDILIHADLHPGNVLRSGETWKAIDPHAVCADRHADIWGLLDPLVIDLPEGLGKAIAEARLRVERYADAAGLDSERAAAWTAMRGQAEALAIDDRPQASAEERAWAVRLHRMANALA